MTPFVLRDGAQFRPGPPYPVTSRRFAADFAEVKRLGGDGVTTPSARTAEQTEIALFWVGSSPYQWNGIARTVSARRGLDLWQKARRRRAFVAICSLGGGSPRTRVCPIWNIVALRRRGRVAVTD